ncbi:hypothetical protein FGO68_gene5751 [Halteria grandinella]|uniref:Uncharacterized protein n=1 Tax=Halteria grandinella TaxID=5974 RepID=A0A8J8NFW4_HALGN|nr:hypothetical protein FGO68_gene5751 [Halteria grandinella]
MDCIVSRYIRLSIQSGVRRQSLHTERSNTRSNMRSVSKTAGGASALSQPLSPKSISSSTTKMYNISQNQLNVRNEARSQLKKAVFQMEAWKMIRTAVKSPQQRTSVSPIQMNRSPFSHRDPIPRGTPLNNFGASPSPLNSALKLLKSRKSLERNPIVTTNKSSFTTHKTLLSPRASPTRPINFNVTPSIGLGTARILQEKSLKLYESLKSPRRSSGIKLKDDRIDINAYKSVEVSASRIPVNLTIKLDSPIGEDDQSDIVRINDDEGGSNRSSSHISKQSSPHSQSTINKSLNAYLSAMSPSPSRLKSQKLALGYSSITASKIKNQTQNYNTSRPYTGAQTGPYTIEAALRDIVQPTKRLQSYIFINRYFSPEALSTRGDFPSRDIFHRVVRILLDSLGDNSQISQLSSEALLNIIRNFHLILEPQLTKFFSKILELTNKKESLEQMNQRENLTTLILATYSPVLLLKQLILAMDKARFLKDTTYMINSYELISSIIQNVQKNQDQQQSTSSSDTPPITFDQLLESSGLIYFIAESIVLSKPWEKDMRQAAQLQQAKSTLFRLSKTLLELLHCVCTQSAFTRTVQQLPHSVLNQAIQVIELTDTDDVDPELFGLLHSVSLDAEPTPTLTYHSSRRQSNGPPGLNFPLQSSRSPMNLESPPPSHRSSTAQASLPPQQSTQLFSAPQSPISSGKQRFDLQIGVNTSILSGGTINTQNQSIDVSGLHSAESQVRTAVTLKLAAMRQRMGEEKFKLVTQGKLTQQQREMIEQIMMGK